MIKVTGQPILIKETNRVAIYIASMGNEIVIFTDEYKIDKIPQFKEIDVFPYREYTYITFNGKLGHPFIGVVGFIVNGLMILQETEEYKNQLIAQLEDAKKKYIELEIIPN